LTTRSEARLSGGNAESIQEGGEAPIEDAIIAKLNAKDEEEEGKEARRPKNKLLSSRIK